MRIQLEDLNSSPDGFDSVLKYSSFPFSRPIENMNSNTAEKNVPSHGDGPLGQLKALMGEAYLLKMALKKQQGSEEGEAGAIMEITTALDAWIYASHNLKKVCNESGTGAFANFTKS